MKLFYWARLNMSVPDASARHVLEFCQEFSRLGHEVTLFLPDSGVLPDVEGVRLVPVYTGLEKTWFTFFSFYLSLAITFPFYYVKFRPDVLYTRHQLLEWLPAFWKYLFGFSYVIEVNGLIPVEQAMGGAPGWYVQTIRLMERIAFRMADGFVCPSHIIRNKCSEAYGLNPEDFGVVTNGANPEQCKPLDRNQCRQQLGLDTNKKIMLFVGSLKAWHGIEKIVELMPELVQKEPLAQLIIVGDGPKRPLLEALIQKLALGSKVVFVGSRPHEEIPVYINAADICLAPYFHPSLDETGISPLKIFEYMACGRPVVLTPAGGLDQVFSGEEFGLQIVSRNPRDWIEPLSSLLNDPERLERYGKRSLELVKEKFTWSGVCRKIEDHLNDRILKT